MKTEVNPPAGPEPAEQLRRHALVSTAWLTAISNLDNVVVVECDEEPHLYAEGHIPGAHHLDWRRDLRIQDGTGIIGQEAFAELAEQLGIAPDTTVVFYGDRANWWAAYALWVFHLHGHSHTRLLDGGRDKWVRENRPLTTTQPNRPRGRYPVSRIFPQQRPHAGLSETRGHSRAGLRLVDVRSPREFAGEITHPPELTAEASLRAGHIPGAVSLPWSLAVTESGAFKSTEKLREIYEDVHGLQPDEDIIVYCRIGERSSHTWFVLTQLLGFRKVRNYAGSWLEWGNRTDTPVAA